MESLDHLKLFKWDPCYLRPPCLNEKLEAGLAFTGVRKAHGLKVCIWQEAVVFLELQLRVGYTSCFTPWAVDDCRAVVAIRLCQGLSFASFQTQLLIPPHLFWPTSGGSGL